MRPVAQIAQSVEQGIENPRVGGSIPSLGTTFSFQVVFTSRESNQKTRLVRVFCCLEFDPSRSPRDTPRFLFCTTKPLRDHHAANTAHLASAFLKQPLK